MIARYLALMQAGHASQARAYAASSPVRRLGSGGSPQAIDGNDEIASLDRLYQEITRRVREALRQKDELLFAYEREHHVASTLQQALLPVAIGSPLSTTAA